MANILFANNASALLAASISDSDTVVQVASGYGALFPSPTGGEYFLLTLENADGDIEIVRCTGRSSDNLTVVRAQEGTTAQAFTLTVTRCELRATAGVLEGFLQLSGDVMSGDIDMDENEIIDAVLTGASTSIQAGEIAGVPIRGATGVTGNQIVVPSNGTSRPTIGGVNIVLVGDDIDDVFAAGGTITSGSNWHVDGNLELDEGTLTLSLGADTFVISQDATDVIFTGTGKTNLNLVGLGLDMGGSAITNPVLVDFAIDEQSVTATTSTTINYASGSYVNLALGTNITTLAISNPPANGQVGTLRLKITSTGTRTIDWSDINAHFPGGTEPALTADGVDFVDLWTDDGGTTWYGSHAADYSAVP